MACGLLESASRFARGCKFLVLDFGLTQTERQHLQSRNALLDAPKAIQGQLGDLHPYVLKTMLGAYVSGLDPASPIIWLDGDMVLGRDITADLQAVMSEMERRGLAVAACEEGRISEILDFANLDLEPFKTLLGLNRIPLDGPYFNSGFVIFRDRQILNDWAELARRTPFHALFDQNLLNLLMHSGYAIAPLSEAVWNLHGRLLEEEPLGEILKGGALPNIIHTTSSLPNHFGILRVSIAGEFDKIYPFKLFMNASLREHQLAFLYPLLERDFARHDAEIL